MRYGRGDEATGVTKVFKIEQNSAGFTVASKEIEQVVNVDIALSPSAIK